MGAPSRLSFGATSEFDVAVALGVHRNTNGAPYLHYSTYGSNRNVGAVSLKPITSLGAVYHTQDPFTLRAKAGGNAADTFSGGAGARSFFVEGLDENGDLIAESLGVLGTGAGNTGSKLFSRVHRAYVRQCGTYGGANVGTITVERSDGSGDVIQIPAGEGQSQYGAFTVPNGYKGLLRGFVLSVQGGSRITFELYTREDVLDFSAAFLPRFTRRVYTELPAGANQIRLNHPIALNPLTDIWFEGRANSGTVAAGVDFDILLVPS